MKLSILLAALFPSTAAAGPLLVQETEPPAEASTGAATGAATGTAPQGRALSLERPGDGRPVCGLGAEFHAGRRKELARRAGDLVMLFRGLPETRDYLAFRQDKTFWYLTGIESPDAALILDAASGREILFLPESDARKESWEGEIWDASDEWIGGLAGFADVRPSETLLETLREVLGERSSVGISFHPHVDLAGCYDRARPYDRRRRADPLDGRESREEALAGRLRELLEVEIVDVGPTLVEMRWRKQPAELAAMRRAASSGARAMVEAMRSTRPGAGEWEIDAAMSFVQVLEGATGPAYHAIVGSGPLSCVLHYSASARRMQGGEVLLIDYGPELDHYTTDITRTWPVSGKFEGRAAELYDVVLEAQLAGIAAVRPGRTIEEIDEVCNGVYRKHGLFELRKHGACHLIGLEVHDPGDRSKPLEPGVCFTIEPGLYDEEAGVGIRIEDVVAVTAEGCEVLTPGVPKERAAVEALIAAPGLLDGLPRD